MATLKDKVIEQSKDGLYYRQWPLQQNENAAESPKAVILLVHGMGEHCQRYDPLARALNKSAYVVCSMDLPHHGRSEGKKGHIDSFEYFQQAVLGLYQRIKKEYPTCPIYILGHSMGGLITSRFLLDHQDKFSGVILSGAAIEFAARPPRWQVIIITLISKIMPKAALIPIESQLVSRDKSVVDAYDNDPLINHNKLSAKLLVEFITTMDTVKQGAKAINLPILIMHGDDDRIISSEGSQWLYDTVASNDKTLKRYNGLYHEIFNEPEAKDVYQEVIDWLEQRNS